MIRSNHSSFVSSIHFSSPLESLFTHLFIQACGCETDLSFFLVVVSIGEEVELTSISGVPLRRCRLHNGNSSFIHFLIPFGSIHTSLLLFLLFHLVVLFHSSNLSFSFVLLLAC
mmetsp:Transcript_13558/g.22180  ORF Transcript_13558/g.22180 Transcript_13558/m.22180 type:complete len:114 (+) Transcript_13558:32-373(+)